MLSDVMSDTLHQMVRDMMNYNDMFGTDIYPKKDIVKLFEKMIYLRMKSDCTCTVQHYTDAVIKENAKIEANAIYDAALKGEEVDHDKIKYTFI